MIPLNIDLEPCFFEEKQEYGFTITKQHKELQAVELDLLVQFDNVCHAHGLSYCVGAGTMLGAVRHKGFIPWDDDVDVYMVRDEYDKFVALANEFNYPYFLQNSYTEENLFKTFSRLRNSLTTGYTRSDQFRMINNGIFIDIFPIDGITPNKLLNTIQHKEYLIYKKLFSVYNYTRSHSDNGRPDNILLALKWLCRKRMVRFIHKNKADFFKRFERVLKRYSCTSTELWGNRTLVFDCPKSRRPLNDYKDVIYMPFETIQVPVPRNYDSMLRQQYGDYLKIPEKTGGNMHGELTISTDYAYNNPRRLQDK